MTMTFDRDELTISARKGLNRTVLELEEKFAQACRWVSERPGVFTVEELLAARPGLTFEDAQEMLVALTAADAVVPLQTSIASLLTETR
jgi:hypothetical protein